MNLGGETAQAAVELAHLILQENEKYGSMKKLVPFARKIIDGQMDKAPNNCIDHSLFSDVESAGSIERQPVAAKPLSRRELAPSRTRNAF